MKAYLAAKYMSGPKADAILSRTNDSVPKKKKRKTTHASSTASASFIKDDDIAGWDAVPKEPEEDDGTDLVVASDRGFKKKQRAEGDSGWATVREGLKNEEEEVNLEYLRNVILQFLEHKEMRVSVFDNLKGSYL